MKHAAEPTARRKIWSANDLAAVRASKCEVVDAARRDVLEKERSAAGARGINATGALADYKWKLPDLQDERASSDVRHER
jgi:hypothetical protein